MKNDLLILSDARIVDDIFSYNLKKLEDILVKKHEWSRPLAQLGIEEYRKFIALQLLTGEFQPMFSEIVDTVWHNHILFTKDYTNFCSSIFGFYLHHEPEDEVDLGYEDNSLTIFINSYELHFGEISKIWLIKHDSKLCQPTGQKICYPTGKLKALCQPTGQKL